MNPNRQFYPIGNPRAGGLSLKPVTSRHIALLAAVDSPLIHIAEMFAGLTEQAEKHFEQFCFQYTTSDVRPTAAILGTSETDLHLLENLEPEQLIKSAGELIPALTDPELTALAWQLCAMHLGIGIERLKNLNAQTN